MISENLEKSLRLALENANEHGHEYATLEHFLLSLLKNSEEVVKVLKACGADIGKLSQDLNDYISNDSINIKNLHSESHARPTVSFQRVLQRAAIHVQSSGREEVRGTDVLVSMFSERESHAVYLLCCQDISRLDVINYISHEIVNFHRQDALRSDQSFQEDEKDESASHPEGRLHAYCTDMNHRAREGLIDPLIGRETEIERVIQTLCRRSKNNPLLVGDPGVGKTAIAEGLALRVIRGDVPYILKDVEIYALDMGKLLAGTRYRGDFEERVKMILADLDKLPASILFIDEIHTVIGAGATSGNAMDASNLLKPVLTSGKLRCIGSTTYKEYRSYFEKDRALLRRFQKIDIKEPSIEDSVRILEGLCSRYESHHGVSYTTAALKRAVELSARYIGDRKLPDKAIDVIDEVGAAQKLRPPSRRKKRIGTEDIEAVVAQLARIPAKVLSRDDRVTLTHLEDSLKNVVFGQDKAIKALTRSIHMARAGLREPEKMIGCYLFSGPTGVGKTETAKQLAYGLGIPLHRFDMSEYMERHSVSRLIGAPPGYVGFDQGGLLADAIDASPHCVLLLDEIEKAHADIFNVLLQVMDYGRLTDHSGRSIDCRHVILIMTTNAGAADMVKNAVGFGQGNKGQEDQEAIERLFSPEFRNRLDAIIPFAHLDDGVIERLVEKFLIQLEAQLGERRVMIELSQAARSWLAKHGYNKLYGARPLGRLIQETVKSKLAEEILFGQLKKGGVAYVDIVNGKITLTCSQEGKRNLPLSSKAKDAGLKLTVLAH